MNKVPSPSEPHSKLFEYVANALGQGRKPADIKKELLDVGWQDTQINEIFRDIQKLLKK